MNEDVPTTRVELVQVAGGRVAVYRYHKSALMDYFYLLVSELPMYMATWPGLPVVLQRSAWSLESSLQKQGLTVQCY